jgi:hypothetical protein
MYIHYTISWKDINLVFSSPPHTCNHSSSLRLAEELLPFDPIAAQLGAKIELPVNQCHPAFFEHALGGGVLRVDQADDLIEAAIREAKVESGLGCLGGIAVAPQTSQHNR